MSATVTAAQALAAQRAAALERRDEIARLRAERRAAGAERLVAPSRAGFAALVFHTLHAGRPAAAR